MNSPAPDLQHPDLPTPIHPQSAMVSAPFRAGTKNARIKGLLLVLVVLLLGITAYIAVNFVNTPARIKEKLALTQPVYESLKRNTQKIAEHLEREPKGDADSLERYGTEGNILVGDAKKDRELLATAIDTVRMPELKTYKADIESYMQKADELIAIEEENVKLAQAVSAYVKAYQKQATEISGASLYIYSDPDKFLTAMDKVATEMGTIIGNLKNVTLTGEMKGTLDSFVAAQQLELNYLKAMKSAVDSRSSGQLTAATQQYATDKKDAEEEYNRATDTLEKNVRDLSDELDTMSDKTDAEYQSLRSKYRL